MTHPVPPSPHRPEKPPKASIVAQARRYREQAERERQAAAADLAEVKLERAMLDRDRAFFEKWMREQRAPANSTAPLVLLVNERRYSRGEQLSPGGSAGKRMRRLVAGYSHAEWPEGVEVVGLFERDSEAWGLAEVAMRRPRRLVLLGRRVAHAFGCGDVEWLRWVRLELPGGHCCAAVVVPHPSNANRSYNSPELRERVSAVLARAQVLRRPREVPNAVES